MDSPLTQAGAVSSPSKYAPLHTNRFFTGMWTQRNPLRDAAVPYLYEKFYAGSRFDSLLDGLNAELTSRLTLARRSGNSVYNSRIFPALNRFYGFRVFSGSNEQIHVMADCSSGQISYTIASTLVANVLGVFTLTVATVEPHGLKVGDTPTFAGLTTNTWLNGLTKTVTFVNDAHSFQVTPAGHFAYGLTPDTGTITVTGAYVFDATGPVTQLAIWKKDPSAGSTFFQGVGNTLYFGNGVEQKKWLQTAKSWAGTTLFNTGDFIVDTNLNIQVALGDVSLSVTNVDVTSNVLTLSLSDLVPINIVFGVALNLSGFVGASFLNGQQIFVSSVNANQIVASFTHANYSGSDSGTAGWTNGPTGGSQPNWNNSVLPYIDGSQQWINKGSSIQNWGIAAPTTSPTAANTTRPSPYPNWAASTFYNPSLVIVDSNSNLQIVQTAGTTGGAPPTWALGVGATTTDGTVTWKNIGPAGWQSAHAYAVNDMVSITYTYYVVVPSGPPPCFSGNVRVKTRRGDCKFEELGKLIVALTRFGPRLAQVLSHEYDGPMFDMGGGELVTPDHLIETRKGWVRAAEIFSDKPIVHYKGTVYNLSIRTTEESERHYFLSSGYIAHNRKELPSPDEGSGETISYPVTVTEFFKCTTAGTSGGTQPHWATGIGTIIYDNQARWTNQGTSITWATIGAGVAVSNAPIVIDSNGNKQQIATPGKTGSAAPTWKTNSGETTIDAGATWLCQGQFSAAGTAPWFYAYAFKNSVSGEVSTASPSSSFITLAENKIITVQGQGSADPQVDVIQIYRCLQGGSELLFLAEIANPKNATWSYNDASPDANLNELILAQINDANDPPPLGLVALTYHLGRIFGSVGNTLYFSNVNSTNGVTTSCFRPVDSFILPSKIVRSWSTPIGLITMTVSDMYITLGQGTASSPFYTVTYLEGIGILNYDAFTVNGSTAYLNTTASKVISLDPSAGVTEIGFPIGDQFLTLYNPASAYMTWHEGSSGDTALYAADGATGWFRMAPTSAPETGVVWSPRAQIVDGCKAVQSLEVVPGVVRLLIGPVASGPILRRDTSVNTDNGVVFSKFVTIGSIVMAQPGSLAELEFITVDAVRVGTRPSIGILLDEISGQFENIPRSRQDPPLLPPSTTLFNDRYIMSQNQQPTFCRHFQARFSWAAEDAHNELLAYTIFGAIHQERT